MQEAIITHLGEELLWIVVLLSLPTVAAASLVGVVLSLLQAITQIQDQTIQFLVKLLVVSGVLIMSYSWMGATLLNYTHLIFSQIGAR
ncbi:MULTISPECIES: type III secretion system export apparatus subunit SctS [Enterobacter cloacae complex]|uniref:type III secretion system export apparatus subunit SctS n=1 Tax=Enterobacter cloacae complex TaxID=354276 RepID=UPI002004776B|nr:type III secretion system export apparatus subunit SctS [Enterobacter asburiae]MCK7227217.1 type III secretion system export apparatus subunit SctS [Enterobacter asburiae]HDR2354467.1 type III secretion system export apparatus subunit SctS [Enterobacter roggenkampii]